ncbi:hypothetical protein AB0H83_44070 [Dactylosporangium sp. NPDC050688]|uniref:hypothetical protein n=1 Tax=Dactylosporangium sp. NPDC050688 TaxID=3157217 RepID=UPI0033D6B324
MPWPAILVREAAQNSWDAKLGDRPVRFRLDLATVLPQHANAWRDLLLEGAPYSDQFPLRALLRGKEGGSTIVRTLTVSDRGTKGLGGPTRADTARGGNPRDWVSFVLNVGDPPDTSRGGGTYGYGKGVFYQISRTGTVIVHTRTVEPEGPQTRLIGICLGESVELPGKDGERRPYTGRHWWGRVEGTYVEPLVDGAAESVAAALGLRPFDGDDTGTDIVIIDPDFGDDSDATTARYLADSIAWNLWPIMLRSRGEVRLLPETYLGGSPIAVPVPEQSRDLKMFVAAYERMTADAEGVDTLNCGNPKKTLGRLVIERQLALPHETPPAAQDLGVPDAPHHVCLLRSPELVVKYHIGPEPASGALAYAGVFKASDELDRTYARAEPPTHDDWVFAQLEGKERTFVRTTFVRIKEKLAEFTRPAPVKADPERAPLGAASNLLGSLVAAAGGSGSGVLARPTGGTGTGDGNAAGRTARAILKLEGSPRFEEDPDGPLLVQRLVVRADAPVTVEGTVSVTVADGTREQEPPGDSGQPRIIGWRIAGRTTNEERLTLPAAPTDVDVELLVRPVPDTVTQIEAGLARTVRTAGGD